MAATRERGVHVHNIAVCVAAIASVAGCVGQNQVYGNIPPSTFQFVTVVDHDFRGSGGWQVAQVAILLGRLSAMFPRAAVCDLEAGMPLVNKREGYISEELAQTESANASDKAAHKLLGQRKKPTAAICAAFRTAMGRYLGSREIGTIAGAKVERFKSWPGEKIPRRTFPPKRGRR